MNSPPGPGCIRLVPLGGWGEIGTNCLAIEQAGGILVVDCGTSFPQDDLGVDVLHADFSWLRERAGRVEGLVLTHGHEDHIGAVPYLLDQVPVPVWGPAHALALVERRLAEHGFENGEVRLHEIRPGERYAIGHFTVEPVPVAHSIIDAMALAIATAAGTVLHTGDFNFDPDLPLVEATDARRLGALGDEGVALLLSDSTNVDVDERLVSEGEVGATLDRLVAACSARAFVSMFASNLPRLSLLGATAQRQGRKICVLGRSLQTQIEVGRRLGRLRWPSDLVISSDDARQWPRSDLLAVVGGSQAERNSALVRLAGDKHPRLVLEEGDTVILSSRIIPGNERAVYALMGALLRKGVVLHTRASEPGVHASGHATRAEQRRMIELVRPCAFVPVHGTLQHLRRHAALAQSTGVGEVLVAENGTPVHFDGQALRVERPVPFGKVAVACGGELLDDETLGRRAELGRLGVVAIALLLDEVGALLAEPQVVAYGVPSVDGDGVALRRIIREVLSSLERVSSTLDEAVLAERVRRAARRSLFDLCGYRPVVQVQVGVAGRGRRS